MSVNNFSNYYSEFDRICAMEMEENLERFEDREDYLMIAQNPFVFNFSLAKKLEFLDKRSQEIQYQLAYLSTLGGAYHLCNNPQVALVIAIRQEQVGRALGSSAIVIRAKVFQAVNVGLLGDLVGSNKLFRYCKLLATLNNWTSMIGFVEAVELWFKTNHGKSSKKKMRKISEVSTFPTSQNCEVLVTNC